MWATDVNVVNSHVVFNQLTAPSQFSFCINLTDLTGKSLKQTLVAILPKQTPELVFHTLTRIINV